MSRTFFSGGVWQVPKHPKGRCIAFHLAPEPFTGTFCFDRCIHMEGFYIKKLYLLYNTAQKAAKSYDITIIWVSVTHHSPEMKQVNNITIIFQLHIRLRFKKMVRSGEGRQHKKKQIRHVHSSPNLCCCHAGFNVQELCSSLISSVPHWFWLHTHSRTHIHTRAWKPVCCVPLWFTYNTECI